MLSKKKKKFYHNYKEYIKELSIASFNINNNNSKNKILYDYFYDSIKSSFNNIEFMNYPISPKNIIKNWDTLDILVKEKIKTIEYDFYDGARILYAICFSDFLEYFPNAIGSYIDNQKQEVNPAESVTIFNKFNKKIKRLKIIYANLYNENIKIIGTLVNLTDLYLSNCNLNTIDPHDITDSFVKLIELTSINLPGNNFDDKLIDVIVLIKEKLINLKKIDLSYNKISNISNIIVPDKRSLFDSIEEINLSNNKISDKSVDNALQVLGDLKNLKRLDLSNNIFTEMGLLYLNKYSFPKELIYFDLSYNNICDTGIEKLTDLMKKLKKLEELHLINIKITDIGADSIIKIVDDLTSLKILSLSYNDFSDQKKIEIKEIFDKKGIEILL
jgi:Leucine-rich repeat (LRR) protein